MLSSQTPRPFNISKSGLPHFGHLIYVCATSGTKCIASVVSLSSLFFLKSHEFSQTLHLSTALALVNRNFVFLNFSGLSWVSAKRKISRSTSCSSPIFTAASVICFNPSFWAICVAAEITASASAHSCIKNQKYVAPIKHIADYLEAGFFRFKGTALI